MDAMLTTTCTHKNNPTGASLATVATGIVCSPPDPASKTTQRDYPIEKIFLLHECFTKYTAFADGDFLVHGAITYAVKAVLPWAAQGGLDAFYHIILERQLGS